MHADCLWIALRQNVVVVCPLFGLGNGTDCGISESFSCSEPPLGALHGPRRVVVPTARGPRSHDPLASRPLNLSREATGSRWTTATRTLAAMEPWRTLVALKIGFRTKFRQLFFSVSFKPQFWQQFFVTVEVAGLSWR